MKYLLLFLLLFIISCAQRIKVPINRMMGPEVTGVGAEVEYIHGGFSQGILDFSNGDTTNPLIISTIAEETFHLGLGAVDKMDIFVEVPRESSTRLGAKIQLIGAPKKARVVGHKLAFTFATGSSQDTLNSSYVIDIDAELKDYSLIHGYRFSDLFLLYESVSVSHYQFYGAIENPSGLNSDVIDLNAQQILGFQIGAIFGSPSIQVKTELGVQRIQWSNTEEKEVYSLGQSLTAGW